MKRHTNIYVSNESRIHKSLILLKRLQKRNTYIWYIADIISFCHNVLYQEYNLWILYNGFNIIIFNKDEKYVGHVTSGVFGNVYFLIQPDYHIQGRQSFVLYTLIQYYSFGRKKGVSNSYWQNICVAYTL